MAIVRLKSKKKTRYTKTKFASPATKINVLFQISEQTTATAFRGFSMLAPPHCGPQKNAIDYI